MELSASCNAAGCVLPCTRCCRGSALCIGMWLIPMGTDVLPGCPGLQWAALEAEQRHCGVADGNGLCHNQGSDKEFGLQIGSARRATMRRCPLRRRRCWWRCPTCSRRPSSSPPSPTGWFTLRPTPVSLQGLGFLGVQGSESESLPNSLHAECPARWPMRFILELERIRR